VEPIVKPVSSPIKAVVPMDFKHTSPPINDSPTNSYVNEQPPIAFAINKIKNFPR